MSHELPILMATAAFVGLTHTLLGPDHYLPFIMLALARKWSLAKTALVTAFCGLGHIAGSVILGLIGVAAGLAVHQLEWIEGARGSLAAWLLIAFGLIYCIWGLRQSRKSKPHTHWHTHTNGTTHTHEHTHHRHHAHIHDAPDRPGITPWALFIIFILGPCEALIPILMVPAAKLNLVALLLVIATFALATLATMVTVVLIGAYGIRFTPLARLQPYAHPIAGATICLTGIAIQFLAL